MKFAAIAAIAAAAIAIPAAVIAADDGVTLTLVPTGAMKKIGFYAPQKVQLTTTRPAGMAGLPPGVTAPHFGALKLGAREHATSFSVVVDEPGGKPTSLWLDETGAGKWIQGEWNAHQQDQSGHTLHEGGGTLDVRYGSKTLALHIGMYMFDPAAPPAPQLKDMLLYYSDYAYDGSIELGGKHYHAMLIDMSASGDFRGGSNPQAGTKLLIDVNGNGKFDQQGEIYDATAPFNIGGTTYALAGLAADGTGLSVVKSAKTVAEVLPPQDLSAGHAAIGFQAKTTDGKAVTFPADYKGKVVLLDFWATWCGPCRAELPNVVKVYKDYHSKGFDILGISLDQKDSGPQLASFTKQNEMTWPQVYDGAFWKAQVAQLYFIESIPHAFLVDGDTGKVLAEGDSIRGEELAPAVAKALKDKIKHS